MSIVGAFVMPHPPLIFPEIGRGEEAKIQKTIDACRDVARQIGKLKPDTIVLTSPHSVMYEDYIHISPGREAYGDMARFNAPQVGVRVRYDEEFVKNLERAAKAEGIAAGTRGEREISLDHATVIPLRFLEEQHLSYQLVRIGISGLSADQHFKLGRCIAKVAKESGKRVVFLASGDLSHKLTKDGPYGYAKEGPKFDRLVTEAFRTSDFTGLMNLPANVSEPAGECGLRSFIIMAGALEGIETESKLLSYEGPFGVGYAVASFLLKTKRDPYVRLAQYAAENFIKSGKKASLPDWVPTEMKQKRAGVFVSIKKNGQLRGCIGTIGPTTGSIAEEIMRNAVASSTEDPRFVPVHANELSDLTFSVDVLGEPEPIDATYKLDVKRYGVIVSSGHKRGLLLPNLEGVDTVEEQLSIALRKAGIGDEEDFSIERFEVVRHQ
jgi:MEMO1 family protein